MSNCKTCEHFRPNFDHPGAGSCCAHPPAAVPSMNAETGEVSITGFFPPVRDADRCGEHKPILC